MNESILSELMTLTQKEKSLTKFNNNTNHYKTQTPTREMIQTVKKSPSDVGLYITPLGTQPMRLDENIMIN